MTAPALATDPPPVAGTRIALLVSFSGLGGVERMMANLAQGLMEAGYPVDMVLIKAQGAHAGAIPAGARTIDLGVGHTLLSLPALARYLRRERPAVLLAAKDRAITVAVMARRLAGVRTRIFGRLGTTLSAALAGQSRLRKQLWYRSMRLFYPRTDGIIAVSAGVAEDVRRITGMPAERVRAVPNPAWNGRLTELARMPVQHPWFGAADAPIILGAGRLTRQKDFPTLLRAFAMLRQQRPCRLVILGQGRQREQLQALAEELGVARDVALPGFTPNPYAYMARAQLFVLSSAWEGSPNVLTEALALGTPVVSTDCPSGPRQILQDGRYGPLVPVGDAAALSAAMSATLDRPLPCAVLQEAARPYTLEASTAGYLQAMGLRAAPMN